MENAAPDVSVATPAPSAPASPPADSSPAQTFEIPHKDDAAYLEWRKTGEIPEKSSKPSKPEASASSDQSAEGEQPEEKTEPASEAGSNRQERRATAQDRLQEILSDLKRAGLSPAELKSFRREAQQAAQIPERTVNPPPPQPEPPKRLEPPVLDNYTSWDEYRKAEQAYSQQMVGDLVREQVQQYIAAMTQQQANQQAGAKLQEAQQRYGEAATETIASTAQALFHDTQVHPAIKGIINDSPVIADLLYVMGSKSDEFQEFLQLARANPGQALRQAVLLEQLVQDELRKGSNGNSQPQEQQTERDESGRFVSQRPPAKRTTEAPPPTREVSGRASPPADETDAAFARGDVRGYFAAANRADIARRQGR